MGWCWFKLVNPITWSRNKESRLESPQSSIKRCNWITAKFIYWCKDKLAERQLYVMIHAIIIMYKCIIRFVIMINISHWIIWAFMVQLHYMDTTPSNYKPLHNLMLMLIEIKFERVLNCHVCILGGKWKTIFRRQSSASKEITK